MTDKEEVKLNNYLLRDFRNLKNSKMAIVVTKVNPLKTMKFISTGEKPYKEEIRSGEVYIFKVEDDNGRKTNIKFLQSSIKYIKFEEITESEKLVVMILYNGTTITVCREM